MSERTARIARTTKETDIDLSVDLDGTGKTDVETGIGFFDHMLTAFGRHGLFDLQVRCKGDLEVDGHHSVEDTGIVLGRALAEALGEKAGIERESAQLDDVRTETWEQTLARYRDAEGLERVMVVELIDRVLVGEGGDIEVVFRFGDPVAACVSRKEGVA